MVEFHPRRAWRALWSATAPAASEAVDVTRDLKGAYVSYVDRIKAVMPHTQAMEHAIGAGFNELGPVEVAVLRHYGLQPDHYVVDVGCGSGRLAKPLAAYLTGPYLGIDLVPELLDHARRITGRPDWLFEPVDHIAIPEADGRADMVCFFSVLTHLLHEQSFWYLEEAKRVLKPGGRIVFSFLEFAEAGHMPIFWSTLQNAKARTGEPLNVFVDRAGIQRWADALALRVVDLRFGSEPFLPDGVLGQSICCLEKPA